MRVVYLDCFAGVSGDMFLGALLGAGVRREVLDDAVSALKLGASLRVKQVDRSGIASTKVDVLVGDQLAEAAAADRFREQEQGQAGSFSWMPETQHQHKTGVPHTHDHGLEVENVGHEQPHEHRHEHGHGRSLSVIRGIIRGSGLPQAVIQTAVRTFELLGESEAKIHSVPVEEIHFHEVGAVDAIVDIVAASAGIHALGVERWIASPLNVGSGMVDCAHGRFPVPAPATADLLRGMPTYSANLRMELVTPTGAALLKVLVEEKELSFGTQPAMTVEVIGYGAGTRDPKGFPNVLRMMAGEMAESRHSRHSHDEETVTVLETAMDDLSPQVLAHVAERALQQGALDVMLTPVIMKKGRPGTLLTVLCNATERLALERLLLTETSTLGIRVREDRRSCLERTFETVETAYGQIKIKIGKQGTETMNANPEFEDCRSAAAAHGVAVKTVQQAAIAAYVGTAETTQRSGDPNTGHHE